MVGACVEVVAVGLLEEHRVELRAGDCVERRRWKWCGVGSPEDAPAVWTGDVVQNRWTDGLVTMIGGDGLHAVAAEVDDVTGAKAVPRDRCVRGDPLPALFDDRWWPGDVDNVLATRPRAPHQRSG